MLLRLLPALLLVPACAAQPRGQDAAQEGISVEGRPGRIAVLDDGELFTEYLFAGQRVPCLYPLCAPGGVPVTRAFPIERRAGEPEDHPHHVSLWFAHGDVNGHDFWQDPKTSIVNGEAVLCDSGAGAASIRARNLWMAGDELLLVEYRTMTFGARRRARFIDFDLRLSPAAEQVTFGDTKEGAFALRLRPELAFAGEGARGAALNSEGEENAGVWGKRARWVAYGGTVGDEQVSVAVLDHPKNPRHPTWWHARDYGLCAANPFGMHAFENAPPGAGAVLVAAAETLRLRYRVVVFRGELDAERVDDEWEDFAGD